MLKLLSEINQKVDS
jgi:uncharacterized coiled-coil protein SlyX